MVKLALISLSKDTPDNFGPIGLLPLFDGLVVDQQIRAAQQAGAQKIILVSPTMSGAVLQYVDKLQGQGIDIEIVRSGHDLVQFAAPENDLIFLGDGVLPGGAMVEKLSGLRDEVIFVAPDSADVSDFERIDRNDRWLEVARLEASRLSGFIDLPEDWDVGSALLRGAVQSECRRELIEDVNSPDGMISNLISQSKISEYSTGHLRQAKKGRGNFLEKFLTWPLTKALLPSLWKAPAANNYLGWAAPIAGILAGFLVVMDLLVTASIALLILGMILLYVRQHIQIFSNLAKAMDIAAVAVYLIAIVVLSSIIIRDSIPVSLAANLVIFVLGLGSVWLVYRSNRKSKWDWIKPDIGLSLIILLGFSLFGSFMSGIYVIALLGMAYLLVSQPD